MNDVELIIRRGGRNKPRCDVWLAENKEGNIVLWSRPENGTAKAEVTLRPDLTARRITTGNFTWDKDWVAEVEKDV